MKINRFNIKRILGDPSDSDFAQRLVYVDLPFPLTLAWSPSVQLTRIRAHRRISRQLKDAFNATWNAARVAVKRRDDAWDDDSASLDARTLELLQRYGITIFGGGWAHRRVRGRSRAWSMHAYGVAFDFDPARNPMGSRSSTFPRWFIDAWKDAGFRWGGDWCLRPDPMHFEIREVRS